MAGQSALKAVFQDESGRGEPFPSALETQVESHTGHPLPFDLCHNGHKDPHCPVPDSNDSPVTGGLTLTL